jgi:hypothetical protein
MIPKSLPHNARETNLELKVPMQEGEEMQSNEAQRLST